MNNLMMKDIPKNEKPRERLLKYGVESLSNEELLSIILKTGTKNYSVKNVALQILSKVDDISYLRDMTIQNLMRIDGIGFVKAMEIISAIELGKRVYYEKNVERINFNNANSIFEYFKSLIGSKQQEYFYCIYLDSKKKLIDKKLLFIGTINLSVVHPREIFKEAYLLSASSIICVHNHPSGDVTPSIQDIELTRKLIEIGKLQGIPVVDHLIIGQNSYYSFFTHRKI